MVKKKEILTIEQVAELLTEFAGEIVEIKKGLAASKASLDAEAESARQASEAFYAMQKGLNDRETALKAREAKVDLHEDVDALRREFEAEKVAFGVESGKLSVALEEKEKELSSREDSLKLREAAVQADIERLDEREKNYKSKVEKEVYGKILKGASDKLG